MLLKLLLNGLKWHVKNQSPSSRTSKGKPVASFHQKIVLEGLKVEESITAICRREGIAPALYYRRSKDFLETGKKRLQGDTQREANTVEVDQLRKEKQNLKEVVAELTLDNRVLKKSLNGTT